MNNNDLVSVDVVLDQIPYSDISSGGYNAPTGMTLTFSGTTLYIAQGFVMANNRLYKLTEDYRKDVTTLFDVGAGSGAVPAEETFEDGNWYVFAVSNGLATDILVSKSLTPVFPFYSTSTDYSAAASAFNEGYRIGSFVVENGEITSVYPGKDMATAFLDKDYVYRDEFNAHTAAEEAALAAETEARIHDVNELTQAIETEIHNRTAADEAEVVNRNEAIAAAIEQEVADRTTAILNAVSEESAARIEKDDELEADIEGLEARVIADEADIADHESRIETLETTATEHGDAIDTINATIIANDAAAVHKAGEETVSGVKTFSAGLKTAEELSDNSSDTTVPNTAWVQGRVVDVHDTVTDYVDGQIAQVNGNIAEIDEHLDGVDLAISGLQAEDTSLSERINPTFNGVTYNATTGKLTFTRDSGVPAVVDLPMELLVDHGYYNSATKKIVLVLANGDEIEIDATDLVDVYIAGNGLTLQNTPNGAEFSVNTIDTSVVDTTVTQGSVKLIQSGAVYTAVSTAASDAATALLTATQQLQGEIDAITNPQSPSSIEARLANVEAALVTVNAAITAINNIIMQQNHHVIGFDTTESTPVEEE